MGRDEAALVAVLGGVIVMPTWLAWLVAGPLWAAVVLFIVGAGIMLALEC